jgi:hypothetical protein
MKYRHGNTPPRTQPTQEIQMTTSRLPYIFAIAITAVALLGALNAAEARERHTTVTGSNGKTASRDVARSGGDVSSSTTGPNGKTSSRQVDRSIGGTQVTVTGRNGQSATRSTTQTDTGSSTTVTTSGGKSATVDVTRQP